MDKVRIGIQGFEIKQGLDEANLTLHLVFDNPGGSYDSYADFFQVFEDFLKDKGYSFKPQSFLDNTGRNLGQNT